MKNRKPFEAALQSFKTECDSVVIDKPVDVLFIFEDTHRGPLSSNARVEMIQTNIGSLYVSGTTAKRILTGIERTLPIRNVDESPARHQSANPDVRITQLRSMRNLAKASLKRLNELFPQ